MTSLLVICAYLALLLGLGGLSSRLFRGTSRDYFVASQSIGPFLLLMSVFGTTMTAFALVGSTGEAYRHGIGVYGLMASWSALVHPLVFFVAGIKLWGLGKRYGYVTQIEVFRDRFESPLLGYLLFPILVGLVVPYLLIGILAAGSVVQSVTVGAFPELFAATKGGVPAWLGKLVISLVVLTYVFLGGLRGAAWANTFQTLVFMVLGVVTFALIASHLGGAAAASERVLEAHPGKLTREGMSHVHFFSYMFVPLSVGMFPHLFQHWLTAKNAEAFRLTVVAHPIFIMIVWIPCILIGVWATAAVMPAGFPGAGELIVPLKHAPNSELATIVERLTPPLMTGLLSAGILAAIMSSLDSQFLSLGTMFTNDIVVSLLGRRRLQDRQKILLARGFVVAIVAVTYLLSIAEPRRVFTLGVWCFSGFAALFPLVIATLYWRRATRAGALACVLTAAGSWLYFFAKAGWGRTDGQIKDWAQAEWAKTDAYLWVGEVMPVAFMFVLATLALVVVSLATKPPSEAAVAKFFPDDAGGA